MRVHGHGCTAATTPAAAIRHAVLRYCGSAVDAVNNAPPTTLVFFFFFFFLFYIIIIIYTAVGKAHVTSRPTTFNRQHDALVYYIIIIYNIIRCIYGCYMYTVEKFNYTIYIRDQTFLIYAISEFLSPYK